MRALPFLIMLFWLQGIVADDVTSCHGNSVAMQLENQVVAQGCSDGENFYPEGEVSIAPGALLELYHVTKGSIRSLVSCENLGNTQQVIHVQNQYRFPGWEAAVLPPEACVWRGNQLSCDSSELDGLFCFAMVKQELPQVARIQAAATVKSFTKTPTQLADEDRIQQWLAMSSESRADCITTKPANNKQLEFYISPGNDVVSFDKLPEHAVDSSADKCVMNALVNQTPPQVSASYKLTLNLYE